jgi:hypothetical protein
MSLHPGLASGATFTEATPRPASAPPRERLLEAVINSVRADISSKLLAGLNVHDQIKAYEKEQTAVLFELDVGTPDRPALRHRHQSAVDAWKGRTRGGDSDRMPAMSAHQAKLERKALDLEARLHLLREYAEATETRLAAERKAAEAAAADAEEARLLATFRAEEEKVRLAAERKRFTAWLEKHGHI